MFSLAVRERCCSVFGAPVSIGVAMAAACCRSIEEYAKKTFPGVQVEPCATVQFRLPPLPLLLKELLTIACSEYRAVYIAPW